MKVFTNHLGKRGVDHVEVEAPMGVTFEVDGVTFEVKAAKNGIDVRLVETRGHGGASCLTIEPHAANSITVKVRP